VAGKINYDDFNKTNFGQCPLLHLADIEPCPSYVRFGG
jgi:hypothetical protein